jgi:hypothetical protein
MELIGDSRRIFTRQSRQLPGSSSEEHPDASPPHLLFTNLWDALLTPDGNPRGDFLMPDRVHSNRTGYLVRVAIMLPILGPPDQKLN